MVKNVSKAGLFLHVYSVGTLYIIDIQVVQLFLSSVYSI